MLLLHIQEYRSFLMVLHLIYTRRRKNHIISLEMRDLWRPLDISGIPSILARDVIPGERDVGSGGFWMSLS